MNVTTPNVDTIIQGDCPEEMKKLPDRSIDAIVTDPPYELAFMGKKWDASGIAYNVDMWGECLRVLKPGGHLLAFGGSRTYHRMACAIEDAGFIVHPMIAWVQGQGFPKATNLSKMLDKDNGAEREYLGPKVYADGTPGHVSDHEHEGWKRPWKSDPEHVKIIKGITAPSSPEAIQWDGWYYGRQSLKPAIEPIGMFQKPPEGRMVDNVRKWGCGAVNVDGCRIPAEPELAKNWNRSQSNTNKDSVFHGGFKVIDLNDRAPTGRFPSNLIYSYPEDLYTLKDNVTPNQLRELAEWLDENAKL